MSRPTDPSEKDLLEFLDGHKPIGKQNPDHVCFDAIRRLIEEQRELEEKVKEWQKRATSIMDDLDTSDSSGVLLNDIRDFDFGKGGK
jgi:hypothetical protein